MAKLSISRPKRIDVELEELIKDVSKKNEVSQRIASRTIARAFKRKINGGSILDEIKF